MHKMPGNQKEQRTIEAFLFHKPLSQYIQNTNNTTGMACMYYISRWTKEKYNYRTAISRIAIWQKEFRQWK